MCVLVFTYNGILRGFDVAKFLTICEKSNDPKQITINTYLNDLDPTVYFESLKFVIDFESISISIFENDCSPLQFENIKTK